MQTSTYLHPDQPQWSDFLTELEGIPVIGDPAQVARFSQDWHTLSPILTRLLAGKRGDLVICPRTEAEILRVAQACVNHRVPLTSRGGGMANYGQSVPIQGGVILDLTQLDQILKLSPGLTRIQAGVRPIVLERRAREIGWEMRLIPSTLRTATLGGFIAGGSGGVGSITYGGLRDRGNLLGLRLVTLEDPPRVLELRGQDLAQVNHGWGLNGIITEIELPLTLATPWVECIIGFEDLSQAVRFSFALAQQDGIPKRLVSLQAWPIPSFFTALQKRIPSGAHCSLVIVAEYGLEALGDLVNEYGGQICWRKPEDPELRGATLMEHCFNHTTLHAKAADPSLTSLQGSFPMDRGPELVDQLVSTFGDELLMHFELVRSGGQIRGGSGHLIRFTTEARLWEIARYEQELGTLGPNVHSYLIEEVGRKPPTGVLELKRQTDPYGLLNPGKTQLAACTSVS